MARTFLIYLILLAVFMYINSSKDIFFGIKQFDDTITMEYADLLTDISRGRCGMACMSFPGCKLFHYENNTCYILPMCSSTGIGTVDVKYVYVNLQYKVQCTDMPGYTPYLGGQFCLKAYADKTDWWSAKTKCEQDGGELLILKPDKFDLIRPFLEALPAWNYWIGASDLNVDGEIIWLDGSPVVVNYWAPNQPDNNHEGLEDCIELWGSMKINDLKCTENITFICENPCTINSL